jgi:arylformamidase
MHSAPSSHRNRRSSPLRLRGVAALCLAPAALLAGRSAFGWGPEPMMAQSGLAEQLGEGEGAGAIDLPAGAQLEKDLAYGEDPAQRLDVYMPKQAKAAPVLFMVHGGAWMVGDKASPRVVTNKMKWWLGKGGVFVSVNYRLVPQTGPAGQADDVSAALAFVQQHAVSWGGDPQRMVVMGHSAGAHIVGLLAADPLLAAAHGAKPWLGTVMLDSASMNVVQTMSAPHYRFYDRVFGDDPAYWKTVSPFHRLAAHAAPMLLVCSSKREDSCPQARAFADSANDKGGKAAVVAQDLTHRQINENLGTAGGYTAAVDNFVKTLGLP